MDDESRRMRENLVGTPERASDPADTNVSCRQAAARSSTHWLRTTREDNLVIHHFSDLELLPLRRLGLALANDSDCLGQLLDLSC